MPVDSPALSPGPGAPVAALATALFLSVAAAAPAAGQGGTCFTFWETLGATHLDLDRAAALTGDGPPATEALYRGGEALARLCGPPSARSESRRARWGLELDVLPAASIVQYNSGYATPQRDGLRWAGRGISSALTGGARARWGPVSAAIAPVVTYQQNEPFDLLVAQVPGLSPYGSYYHAGRIDLPQRFGEFPSMWSGLGQSYVRADARGAAAGFSTETLRWGPARRNPLLMSGAAPGFPHAFIGTSRPVDVWIGRLEVEAVWGRLEESLHFDTLQANDRRQLAGLVVAFSPGEDTGLTLGAARAFLRYIPPGGLPLDELILGPYRNVRENPGGPGVSGDNQLLSVFFRWAFPEAGFEVYGEYARDDHWEDFEDLVMEPDHSRAYTTGLQKVFMLGDRRRLRVAAEATNLNSSPTWQSGRPQVQFYTHSQVRHGHTHRGQILGAPIGVGSDAQYVAADYFTEGGLLGLEVERVRYDNDTYYNRFRFPFTYRGHDTELSIGLRGGAFFGGLQAMGELGFSYRWNRDFLGISGATSATEDRNFRAVLGLAWVPGAGRSDP